VNRPILITGGAGFIGFALARKLLDSGYSVDLVDNFFRGVRDRHLIELETDNRLRCLNVDLMNDDSVVALENDYHAVFHLAAIIGVHHVRERPYEVLIHNVRMLANVIALVRNQKRCSRLLFASTSEVYAGTLKHGILQIPTVENSPLVVSALSEPRSTYMLSKIYGEMMCQQSGVPFTIFRPHNIYGPRMGMAHVIPEQLRRISNAAVGDRIEVQSPNHRRAFCFIDDAIEMLKRMLETESCEGATLNLGAQGEEIRMSHLVRICSQIVGKEPRIEDGATSNDSPTRRCPDMTETKDMINFEARVDLDTGLRETWDWYRENIFSNSTESAV